MEASPQARLPSIRELELSVPASVSPLARIPVQHGSWVSASPFPAFSATTPSPGVRDGNNARPSASTSLAGGDEREHGGASSERRGTSVSHVVRPDRPSATGVAPAAHVRATENRDAHRIHFPQVPPHHHSRISPYPPQHRPEISLSTDFSRPSMNTPPRSPDQTPLVSSAAAISAFSAHSDSFSPPDEAIAESRRQRRESKERRRRKDQRSLTQCMEQSVPPWVFSRLKTRHSGSKVNGGGRATNAVISGACIWLRVLNRAVREQIPLWSNCTKEGAPAALELWMRLVDEEANALDETEDDAMPDVM